MRAGFATALCAVLAVAESRVLIPEKEETVVRGIEVINYSMRTWSIALNITANDSYRRQQRRSDIRSALCRLHQW